LAEICEKYLTKGDKIYCEGRIKTRQWEGEDGAKRYSTEIHVVDMTFLTTKRDLDSKPTQTSSQQTSQKAVTEPEVIENDDLPF